MNTSLPLLCHSTVRVPNMIQQQSVFNPHHKIHHENAGIVISVTGHGINTGRAY
ncbi:MULTISPECIES: hypothetical protein [unclassified Providencia]|uniref:hypothetical protein n=1 Tax=unclassified Providencia TaxID=2633465 RepID=UPI00234A795F|nr:MULTISPECIES: hypothetical protein [unclassified Providencia]WOB99312.1 hypothetical protein P3L55_18950 [Providencia sp. PROV046]